jgi:hypothetical protein
VPAVQDPGFGNEKEKQKASHQHQHQHLLPKPELRTSADGALSVASFNVDEGRARLATRLATMAVTVAAATAMLHGRSVGKTAQTKLTPPTETLVEALLMTERRQPGAAVAAAAAVAVAVAAAAAVAKQQQQQQQTTRSLWWRLYGNINRTKTGLETMAEKMKTSSPSTQ